MFILLWRVFVNYLGGFFENFVLRSVVIGLKSVPWVASE